MNRTLILNVKKTLTIQPLTLVKIVYCVLNGADGVEKISVVSSSVFCADSGRLGEDELLSLKFPDVLGNGSFAHSYRPSDGAVARITLEGFTILTVHQVGVDSDLPEG